MVTYLIENEGKEKGKGMIKFKRSENYNIRRSCFGNGEYTITNKHGVVMAYGGSDTIIKEMERIQQFDLAYNTKSTFSVKPFPEV